MTFKQPRCGAGVPLGVRGKSTGFGKKAFLVEYLTIPARRNFPKKPETCDRRFIFLIEKNSFLCYTSYDK